MLLDDISIKLAEAGLGSVGVNIFKGRMPTKPIDCIGIYEYAGDPHDLEWDGEYPGLQLQVRNSKYNDGRQVIEQAKNVLHGLANTIVNGHKYLLIQALQSPFALRMDGDAIVFACNFRVIKKLG